MPDHVRRTFADQEQFPMSEYVKDPANPSGWKTIAYQSAGKHGGGESDGAPLTAEGMEEGDGESDDGGEAEAGSGRMIRP